MVRLVAVLLLTALLTACASSDDTTSPTAASSTAPSSAGPSPTTPTSESVSPSATPPVSDAGTTDLTRPDWLGTRTLPTAPDGVVVPQTTPPELIERRLPTVDTLPAPADAVFSSTAEPLQGEPLERSTWQEGCPVAPEELRYVTVTFWGFDDLPHQGELIVHADVADDLIGVFEQLFEARFPIEEMRIVTPADVDAEPTGDGNNTSSFVCRAVVGGTRFSEHAHGLAIDINPFQNPYVKDDLVLPELATSYIDREMARPGMVGVGLLDNVAVQAFDAIGWGWGGRWSSLKDYQHFALNDR